MSNIRTIADIQQEENSVQSITLREMTEDISTQTTFLVPRSVLNDDLRDLAPILNIIIYANVGFYDFNASTTHLSTLLSEVNPSQDLYENNLEEVGNLIDENTDDVNNNSEERNEEYNRERSNVLNSLNWRTILRRGGTLLVMGAATYLGAPYLGPLGNLGMRILENSPNPSSQLSNGTDITPRIQTSRITWTDVSGSFWNSWSLLARYMGRRSD